MTQEQLLAYEVKRSKDVNKSDKFVSIKKDDGYKPADDGLEAVLLRKISSYFAERGIYFFHDRSCGKNKSGHPDITACLPKGRVVFLELKSKMGRLSDQQRSVKLKLLGTGHEFYECRSFKRFLEIINEV
jgi:hypothetical protein